MGQLHRRRVTILADYRFLSSAVVDDSFQFIDCEGVNRFGLAKDIRSGVVCIENTRIIIALGNDAKLDQFSNVSSVVVAVINAIFDRYGCVGREVWVAGILPKPLADVQEAENLKIQNKSLFKSVRALVHRKQYPLKFITAYKWLLKRVKNPDGTVDTEPDLIYYEQASNWLNAQGLAHLHLLLAQKLNLRRIKYCWEGMPMVSRRVRKRRVGIPQEEGKEVVSLRQLRKGHGN